MSYDTLVMDPKYLNQPGVEYAKFEWKEPTGLKTVHFVQSREGVLPRICTDLAVWRKDAKREMATAANAGNKALEEVMNG
jgi:DNA polymerase elongation subunit (family B)